MNNKMFILLKIFMPNIILDTLPKEYNFYFDWNIYEYIKQILIMKKLRYLIIYDKEFVYFKVEIFYLIFKTISSRNA